MPERLDRVQIQLASQAEPMVISWETRDQMLSRLKPNQASIGSAFRAVGASQPVRLLIGEKAQLLGVLQGWLAEVGVDQLPDGVLELRNTLIIDLHEASRRP